jgi:hypothetical protein
MHDANVKANLLTKTLCPGLGYAAREHFHCPCTSKTFQSTIGCTRFGHDIESRPCAECGINTCDECRIHVFYNPRTEDPGLDQRRWWAGYFFLEPLATAVYPPKNTKDKAWHLPIKEMKSLHDQGRVHIPLAIPAVGDPEPIDRILDMNLGRRHGITPLGRTEYPYSGFQIVSDLNLVINRRKELVCGSCYEQNQEQGQPQCSCTLRKRFLNRWVCIPCYFKEKEADQAMRSRTAVDDDSPHGHHHLCGCGAELADDYEPRVLCNWCKGEVIVAEDEDVTDVETETEDDADQEDEVEEHSSADFAHLEPTEFGYARNRGGTFSVCLDGHSFRGERLSLSLVRQAMAEFDMEVDCTCCVCHGRQPHDEQDEDHEMNEGDEGGEGDEDDSYWEDVEESGDKDMPDLVQTDGASDDEQLLDFDEEEEPDLLESDDE